MGWLRHLHFQFAQPTHTLAAFSSTVDGRTVMVPDLTTVKHICYARRNSIAVTPARAPTTTGKRVATEGAATAAEFVSVGEAADPREPAEMPRLPGCAGTGAAPGAIPGATPEVIPGANPGTSSMAGTGAPAGSMLSTIVGAMPGAPSAMVGMPSTVSGVAARGPAVKGPAVAATGEAAGVVGVAVAGLETMAVAGFAGAKTVSKLPRSRSRRPPAQWDHISLPTVQSTTVDRQDR
jgi:hypothetical protein